MPETTSLILREYNGQVINQRRSDQYIDATAMCKAAGKRWNDYCCLENTKSFVDELSADTRIPVSALIESRRGGNDRGGTYVHPKIAIHLAQWCSPKFAVQVSTWIFELLSAGEVRLEPQQPQPAINLIDLAQAIALALSPTLEKIVAVPKLPQERRLDLVDPREQIRKRWPTVTPRTMANIIRHMDNLHRNNLGRPCPQLGLDVNSPLMIEREHLWMVDRAIDRYLPSGPLFDKEG